MPARYRSTRKRPRHSFAFFVVVPLMLASGPLFGNDGKKTIQIQDLSDKGSPIQISGQVTVGYDRENQFPFTYEESASIKNTSGKPILLMVVRIETSTGPRDLRFSQEYFFGDALAPGQVEAQEFPEQRFGTTVADGATVPNEPDPHPMAKAQAEFVQFSDGSTWGDADSAAGVLESRCRTMAELDLLEHLYEQEGENAFLDELAQTDTTLDVLRQLKDRCINSTEYANCTHDGVHRTFVNAKERQAALASPSQ